jgi:hypothetical protein
LINKQILAWPMTKVAAPCNNNNSSNNNNKTTTTTNTVGCADNVVIQFYNQFKWDLQDHYYGGGGGGSGVSGGGVVLVVMVTVVWTIPFPLEDL